MALLQQARAQGKIAYFRHTKLIIKNRINNGAAAQGLQRSARNLSEARVGDAAEDDDVRVSVDG